MMNDISNADRFKHRVSITLTSRIPIVDIKSFIKELVGGRCKDIEVELENFDTEAYTPEQLDPLNEESYVGHNIAIEMNVPCCCEFPGSTGPKAFCCPYHGR